MKNVVKKMNGRAVSFSVSLMLASAFVLCSCEKVTVDVPVDRIVIELDDILVEDGSTSKSGLALKSDDGLNKFDVTRDVNLSDLSLDNDVLKYQSRIKDVIVGAPSITVTSASGEGTVVKDFVMKVDGVHSISIAQYNLGSEYTADLADLQTFCQKAILNLLLKGSISVALSGKTDVAAGESLNVEIVMNDVVIKAKLNSDE